MFVDKTVLSLDVHDYYHVLHDYTSNEATRDIEQRLYIYSNTRDIYSIFKQYIRVIHYIFDL